MPSSIYATSDLRAFFSFLAAFLAARSSSVSPSRLRFLSLTSPSTLVCSTSFSSLEPAATGTQVGSEREMLLDAGRR